MVYCRSRGVADGFEINEEDFPKLLSEKVTEEDKKTHKK